MMENLHYSRTFNDSKEEITIWKVYDLEDGGRVNAPLLTIHNSTVNQSFGKFDGEALANGILALLAIWGTPHGV